jgi:uncharacterized membrane protein YoaK (UPF0700 family)
VTDDRDVLIHEIVGWSLFALGVVANILVSRRATDLPVRARVIIVLVEVVALLSFYAITNLSHWRWWIVPVGFAGSSLIGLLLLQALLLSRRRPSKSI